MSYLITLIRSEINTRRFQKTREAHFRGHLAQASAWCLLEPSRVVFHSFRGLNHLLSSVSLFGVYDSGLRCYFLDKSSCSHEITKACGIH